MAEIVMPQLGETVTEGTITKWLKAPGDRVERDEPLFEVSTDKVDSEVPSAEAGVLSKILVQEGETVAVGTALAVIGESADEVRGQPETGLGPPPLPQSAPETPPPLPQSSPELTLPGENRDSSTTQVAPGGPISTSGDSQGRLLSPVVRRLIHENRLDPTTIVGTGPGGRITRDDVLGEIDARSSQGRPLGPEARGPSSNSVSSRADQASSTLPSSREPGDRPTGLSMSQVSQQAQYTGTQYAVPGQNDEVVAFSNIRRRTAEHMVRSKATSAHTLVVTEVDYEHVESVRRHIGDDFKAQEGHTLTYLPFLVVAVVQAIRSWPVVNSSVGDDCLIVHHDINIGIAVDLNDEGLIVPVIQKADSKRLRAIAREIRELAEKARTKRLGADDIAGGTFTITNPGPFGTLLTAPIINQPQVAILSTDSVKRRPVVITNSDGSESIGIHSVGNLALSFDHRVIDGAVAARFLNTMKEVVETRDWNQEL